VTVLYEGIDGTIYDDSGRIHPRPTPAWKGAAVKWRTIALTVRSGERMPSNWRGPVSNRFGDGVWAPLGPAFSTDGRTWEAGVEQANAGHRLASQATE
jgi:hypothetical protein